MENNKFILSDRRKHEPTSSLQGADTVPSPHHLSLTRVKP